MTTRTTSTKKRKAASLPKLKGKAQTLLQKLVRMKAADSNGICRCASCGKAAHWKEMDGGHFISRRYTFHTLREENIHPQCKMCNRFFGTIHDDYRRYMVDMYGEEFVQWLSDTKNKAVKMNRMELEATIAELNQRIKDQEIRLNLA